MKKNQRLNNKKMNGPVSRISFKLLFSYLVIILAPAIATLIIYVAMRNAMLGIQIEKTQTLLNEAVMTFNNEIEQMVNVGRYISSDAGLKDYVRKMDEVEESYYQAYKLAVSYPDYVVLNRFIKNIYVYVPEASYVFEIPRVIPNTSRGLSTLGINQFDEMLEMNQEGLIAYGTGGKEFLVLQRFDCGKGDDGKGVVVLEVELSQLRKLLRNALGSDRGAAFLVDEDGATLCAYDQLTDKEKTDLQADTWKRYIEDAECGEKDMIVQRIGTDYNQWSIVIVMYRSDLLSKIGDVTYAILFLCISSILIGVAICFWYWSASWPVMRRYALFSEKYPERHLPWKTSVGMWKSMDRVLDYAETMQERVGQHEQWATDEILRKILYGSYGSREDLKNEIREAKISYPVKLPCRVIGLSIEDSMKRETGGRGGIIEGGIRGEMDRNFPERYLLVDMGLMNYALIIYEDERMDDIQCKRIFEEINLRLCQDDLLSIYTGIGRTAESILGMAEEYEHVCRICEYARDNKIRVPLTIEEIPDYHQAVFTVNLEMQMEETIRYGTSEQFSALMSRISENYLRVPGGIRTEIEHNMEILRYILLRCLDKEENADLLQQMRRTKTPDELVEIVFKVWQAFADRRKREEELNECLLKKEMEEKLEQNYSDSNFNMAMLACLMKMPEKKLYRDFKELFGISFSSYLETIRIRYARNHLKEGMSVQDVAAACGYGSDYTFRRAFKRVVGITPSDYQKRSETVT